MNGLLPLLGAAFAVALLVLLSFWLGFRGKLRLDGEGEALVLAQSIAGGFAVKRVLVAEDRRHALLVDHAGRVAIVLPHGAHFIARLFDGSIIVTQPEKNLELGFGHGHERVVAGEQLPVWLELLHQARGSK